MHTGLQPSAVALVIAAGMFLASDHATEGGDKDKKLTPAVGKIALKDGKRRG